ncbi:MAG: hypothetical protein GYB67_08990 [Chloroflexi bacterium]|nr:hypothetical protein [Chloroflexota bacterium]
MPPRNDKQPDAQPTATTEPSVNGEAPARERRRGRRRPEGFSPERFSREDFRQAGRRRARFRRAVRRAVREEADRRAAENTADDTDTIRSTVNVNNDDTVGVIVLGVVAVLLLRALLVQIQRNRELMEAQMRQNTAR